MKTTALFSACLMALFCMSSCNDDANAPGEGTDPHFVTTQLGERTCSGELVMVPNPPHDPSQPTLPGAVLALRTESDTYVLTLRGSWCFDDRITVDGTQYEVGNRVEISGAASSVQVSDTDVYLELEIGTIVKQTAGKR